MTAANEADEKVSAAGDAESRSRLVAAPGVSVIQQLGRSGSQASDRAQGFGSTQVLAPPPPDLLQFRSAVEAGEDLFRGDPDFGASLMASDPAAIIVRLFDEIREKNSRLRAASEDAHALRQVNADLEQQLLDALAGADDTRIALMDALERATDETLAREAEVATLLQALADEAERTSAMREEFEAERAVLQEQLLTLMSAK